MLNTKIVLDAQILKYSDTQLIQSVEQSFHDTDSGDSNYELRSSIYFVQLVEIGNRIFFVYLNPLHTLTPREQESSDCICSLWGRAE